MPVRLTVLKVNLRVAMHPKKAHFCSGFESPAAGRHPGQGWAQASLDFLGDAATYDQSNGVALPVLALEFPKTSKLSPGPENPVAMCRPWEERSKP